MGVAVVMGVSWMEMDYLGISKPYFREPIYLIDYITSTRISTIQNGPASYISAYVQSVDVILYSP